MRQPDKNNNREESIYIVNGHLVSSFCLQIVSFYPTMFTLYQNPSHQSNNRKNLKIKTRKKKKKLGKLFPNWLVINNCLSQFQRLIYKKKLWKSAWVNLQICFQDLTRRQIDTACSWPWLFLTFSFSCSNTSRAIILFSSCTWASC